MTREAGAQDPFAAISHRRVRVGDLELHLASLGSGRPVLLLHGFPEFWYSWRRLMLALADSGFQALAPDLRGYDLSDKPRRRSSYRMERLVSDVVGLLDALGLERVPVVAHDWGGIIAYCLAERHPERVERLVILNAPHPELFRRALRRPSQLSRSWYVFFFLLPLLPEWTVTRRRVMASTFEGWARPGAFTREDIDRYVEAIRRPGAATSAINYYRAAFGAPIRAPTPIQARTLVLWGDRDRALGPALLDGIERYVPDVTIRHFPEAGHWLQHDAPEQVAREIIGFLG